MAPSALGERGEAVDMPAGMRCRQDATHDAL
jgi:hypothetical protein